MSWTRIAVLVGVLLLAAGCGLPTTTTGAPPTRSTSAPGSPGTALDRLAIAPDGPLTGYDREECETRLHTAPACDTRDVVLTRDTTVRHGCDVVAGTPRHRLHPRCSDRPPHGDAFGVGWASTGHNCTTRDVLLGRHVIAVTNADPCVPIAGTLRDPYSGIVVVGPTRRLDIDHRRACRKRGPSEHGAGVRLRLSERSSTTTQRTSS